MNEEELLLKKPQDQKKPQEKNDIEWTEIDEGGSIQSQSNEGETNLADEMENPIPEEPSNEMTTPDEGNVEENHPIQLNSSPTPIVEEQEHCDDPQCESEQTFTQSQVNDMMGKVRQETRDRTFKYIYDRYGVNDEKGMDEMIGNAQRYDFLNDEYSNFKKEATNAAQERDNELNSIKEQLAFLQSGIDKERYDDAKFILKGKGLDVSLDNILNELTTHPEWKKVEPTLNANSEIQGKFEKEEPSQISVPQHPVLGNDLSNPAPESDEDKAMKMFGLRK